MVVSRESPKIPKILNHESYVTNQPKNVREREESVPEIIKLLINDKDGNIREEHHTIENIQQEEDSMEYDEEEMECEGQYC